MIRSRLFLTTGTGSPDRTNLNALIASIGNANIVSLCDGLFNVTQSGGHATAVADARIGSSGPSYTIPGSDTGPTFFPATGEFSFNGTTDHLQSAGSTAFAPDVSVALCLLLATSATTVKYFAGVYDGTNYLALRSLLSGTFVYEGERTTSNLVTSAIQVTESTTLRAVVLGVDASRVLTLYIPNAAPSASLTGNAATPASTNLWLGGLDGANYSPSVVRAWMFLSKAPSAGDVTAWQTYCLTRGSVNA
jgi:hypothetical protein